MPSENFTTFPKQNHTKQENLPLQSVKLSENITRNASSRANNSGAYAELTKMPSNPVKTPLIKTPMSDTLVPPSPIEASSSLPKTRCISSSYEPELCLPDIVQPCGLENSADWGLGPCSSFDTGMPVLHPQAGSSPIGTRWKMTKTGYILNLLKQCTTRPSSM